MLVSDGATTKALADKAAYFCRVERKGQARSFCYEALPGDLNLVGSR